MKRQMPSTHHNGVLNANSLPTIKTHTPEPRQKGRRFDPQADRDPQTNRVAQKNVLLTSVNAQERSPGGYPFYFAI